MRSVVGISGASGIVYGVRLLEELPGHKTVIVSADAAKIAKEEMSMSLKDMHSLADEHYSNDDLFSPLASGSVKFENLIIAPCSTSTMSKISCGIADNLMTRVASVALKERRRTLFLIRETPLSSIHLSNMRALTLAGAVVMPACPAFYPRPECVDDMVDFVVGRMLDVLGLENDLYGRWDGGKRASRGSRGSRRTRR